MKKVFFLLFVLMLTSCMKYPEETRTFKLYLSSSPPEGGTVTIELTDETQGEYLWGDVVSIKALASPGYNFEKFSGNIYLGDLIVTTGNGADKLRMGYTSLGMSCPDPTFCVYDINVTGNFVKKD